MLSNSSSDEEKGTLGARGKGRNSDMDCSSSYEDYDARLLLSLQHPADLDMDNRMNLITENTNGSDCEFEEEETGRENAGTILGKGNSNTDTTDSDKNVSHQYTNSWEYILLANCKYSYSAQIQV